MTAVALVDLATLPDPIRMRMVAEIVEEARGSRSHDDALLMLDVAGLTGDRDALHAALRAVDDPSYAAAIATLASPAHRLDPWAGYGEPDDGTNGDRGEDR